MIGRMWLGTDVRALFGKHYCIYCGGLLKLEKNSKIILKESDEARIYNYDAFDDFKIIWEKFKCQVCEKSIECVTQLSYEAHKKRIFRIEELQKNCKEIKIIDKSWYDEENSKIDGLPDLESSATNKKYFYRIFIQTTLNLENIELSVADRVKFRQKAYKISCSKKGRKEYKKLFFK